MKIRYIYFFFGGGGGGGLGSRMIVLIMESYEVMTLTPRAI